MTIVWPVVSPVSWSALLLSTYILIFWVNVLCFLWSLSHHIFSELSLLFLHFPISGLIILKYLNINLRHFVTMFFLNGHWMVNIYSVGANSSVMNAAWIPLKSLQFCPFIISCYDSNWRYNLMLVCSAPSLLALSISLPCSIWLFLHIFPANNFDNV